MKTTGCKFNVDMAVSVCRNFALATGIELMLLNSDSSIIYMTDSENSGFLFCGKLNSIGKEDEMCAKTHMYGSVEANRFGGRYIFFCHMGLLHFATPIVKDEGMVGSIVSEPILMIDRGEYLENDIFSKYTVTPGDAGELERLINNVKFVPPGRVTALSELLYSAAEGLSRENIPLIEKSHETHKLQSIISDYISKLKKKESGSPTYSLEKEDELLDSMTKGDKKAAKALLNEILGHIFFHSGYNYDIIRSRVIELISLLSRAAVRGGADMELVLGLNYRYLNDIDNITSIEDLAYWLSAIMNRFMDYVFNYVELKHVDVMHKAVNYIKSNYMSKIALEDVAAHVHLSSAYFSKIFKAEIKEGFNTYLNTLRIEESKKLLLRRDMNIAEVSLYVGYEDQSYFTKVFRRITGMSPGKYRRAKGLN